MANKSKPKVRVLVVEDDDANILLATINLEDLGVPFDIARNSKEALKFAKTNIYNLILMDIRMQGLDGFETTRLIRLLEKEGLMPETPIVALTSDDDKERCLESGMDDYITKPLRLETLKRCIENNATEPVGS